MVIAVILLLLLLWWILQPTETELTVEAGWRNLGNPSESSLKLHEEEFGMFSVRWDNCCEGEIRAEFEHSWDFYFPEWIPESGCCHENVVWTVQDSLGNDVYTSAGACPVDTFGNPKEIRNGIWNCITPWTVTVFNGCLYPISYGWELTLWCYD